jgi:hypothetical protein
MSKKKAQHGRSAHTREEGEPAEEGASEAETGSESETAETRALSLPAIRTRVVGGAQDVVGGARRVLGRGVKLAKDHPTATAAVAVGAVGAIIEAELAAAALVGMGVTMLVTRKTGPELRNELGSWVRRGRSQLAGQLARLEQVIAPPGPEEAPQSG